MIRIMNPEAPMLLGYHRRISAILTFLCCHRNIPRIVDTLLNHHSNFSAALMALSPQYTPSGPYSFASSQLPISPYAPQPPPDAPGSPGLSFPGDQAICDRPSLGAGGFNIPPTSSSPLDQTPHTSGHSASQHGRQGRNNGSRPRDNQTIQQRPGHGPSGTLTGSHSQSSGMSKPSKKGFRGLLNSDFYGGQRNNRDHSIDPQLQ